MYPELPDEGTQPVRQVAADAETHIMEKQVMTTRSIEIVFVMVLRVVMVIHPFLMKYRIISDLYGVLSPIFGEN